MGCMGYDLFHGDCLKVLSVMKDNSIDSIVTDPPYGLSAARNSGKSSKGGFMGKKWDYDVPSVEIWREALRVLKPGGYLLSFAGSRTYHRMAVNIEDAGFEIRDQIMWVYGSGFPKSQSISKNIDKKAANPQTDEAIQWEGWGSALKPAHEPIVVARKPLIGTIVENVLEHGTGGLNIDGCRVGSEGGGTNCNNRNEKGECKGHDNNGSLGGGKMRHGSNTQPKGRFPTNFIHDGSDEVVDLFPHTQGGSGGSFKNESLFFKENDKPIGYTDSGSAARFFYCAKVSRKERDEGCENIEQNFHPTVKPVDLMRYLCRLVTPQNGVILDPFMGSGTTGIAASVEAFNFIGIERDEEYIEIAKNRISHWDDEEEEKRREEIYQKSIFEWS